MHSPLLCAMIWYDVVIDNIDLSDSDAIDRFAQRAKFGDLRHA
jgi:hypothetical protein